ncbi:MAG: vitamin K epoxide reductase family protein [Candidatus Pacebacteria bacterium]|nr:vitamin K epoxide reductase family protein [Candidatus Paceibacterota bacterium]
MRSMRISRTLFAVCIVFALIGFADSAFLTAEHVRGVIPPCGASSQCDTVLTSAYASVAGVPVAALGMIYYGTIILLLIAHADTGSRKALHSAAWVICLGMLGTLYFVFVQAFILHAWCYYCLASAVSTVILFVCAIRSMRID